MADRILDSISSPSDIKVLSDEELGILAREIRDEIVEVTSSTGGHVASSLGAVEIILAVHSLIDSPQDKLVFDVGHQSYAHKLITGRLDRFPTLRKFEGLSGFPRPKESPHDVHPSGHASDSLSIALGLAKARQMRGTNEKIVAIIGDAALSGGMAFEALNTIGQLQLPVVIVLNDNEMSISKNVGALMKHLGAVRSSARYRQARDSAQASLESGGAMGSAVVSFGRNVKESMKQFVLPQSSMLFEKLGIICTPPVDGNDITALKDILRTALAADGPVLVHAVTKKGAGYEPAEREPERFHGPSGFDVKTGASISKPAAAPTFTAVFGDAIIKEAEADERIVAITAAMKSGTGLDGYAQRFPQRFVDVGIAEENAVAMAAGLAIGGMKPVVAIYSTFLQRAFDQIVINVALPRLDVVFAIDRAGVVGADGSTHNGMFDVVYLRTVPHMRILAPSNEEELANALHTALKLEGPVAVRYPRGAAAGVGLPDEAVELPEGKAIVRREGADIALLAWGDMVKTSLEAAELLLEQGIDARVVDMRWVKPLDREAIASAASTHLVVTVEDGMIAGGVGEAVMDALMQMGSKVPALALGVDDRFVTHGTQAELLHMLGLDGEGICNSVIKKLAQESLSDIS